MSFAVACKLPVEMSLSSIQGDQIQGSLMCTTYKMLQPRNSWKPLTFTRWPSVTMNLMMALKDWLRLLKVLVFLSLRATCKILLETNYVLDIAGEKIGIVSAFATDTVKKRH